MKRKLTFKDGIIDGELARDMIEIFPETKDSFTRRKSYDEFYYKETTVEISIEKIEAINKFYYCTIYSDRIIVV